MDMEQISELDENDAPEGYRAVALVNRCGKCHGCAFWDGPKEMMRLCGQSPCHSHFRADKANVIFLKREPANQWRPSGWIDQPTFDARMREALRITSKDRAARARAQDSDSYGINRAEKIKSWEMAAERMCPTPDPEKSAPAGLATLAPMGNQSGRWGA